MQIIRKSVFLVVTLASAIGSTGCATIKTLEPPRDNRPIFFSGTRLDLNAINNNEVALKKFKVSPPKYPMLDLPASFVLDAIVSPATGIITLSEVLTE